MYNYILEPKAQEEYETAIDWYSDKSELITLNFIESVDKTLELICSQPYQFKSLYKNFHEASTKKFPFAIIYTIEEKIKRIAVISMFHHKRNPTKRYKK